MGNSHWLGDPKQDLPHSATREQTDLVYLRSTVWWSETELRSRDAFEPAWPGRERTFESGPGSSSGDRGVPTGASDPFLAESRTPAEIRNQGALLQVAHLCTPFEEGTEGHLELAGWPRAFQDLVFAPADYSLRRWWWVTHIILLFVNWGKKIWKIEEIIERCNWTAGMARGLFSPRLGYTAFTWGLRATNNNAIIK